MTAYPAGPYLLTIDYVWDNISHEFAANCDVIGTPTTGDDPDSVIMRTKGSVSVDLQTAADALWTVIRMFFNGTTLASTYTLWKTNPDNEDRLFISGGVLTSPNGGNISAPNGVATEAIWTFRTGNGNVMKVNLLEGVFGGNVQIPMASDTTPGVLGLRTYMTGDNAIVMARDRSFAVAPMNSSYGQNEKTWRRRFRP